MAEEVELNDPIWETVKYTGYENYKLIIYGITPTQKTELDRWGEFKITIKPARPDEEGGTG